MAAVLFTYLSLQTGSLVDGGELVLLRATFGPAAHFETVRPEQQRLVLLHLDLEVLETGIGALQLALVKVSLFLQLALKNETNTIIVCLTNSSEMLQNGLLWQGETETPAYYTIPMCIFRDGN